MAVTTVRTCDVYGTTKGIKRARITVALLDDDGNEIEPAIVDQHKDLSARGCERLVKNIERALAPPKSRGARSSKPQ